MVETSIDSLQNSLLANGQRLPILPTTVLIMENLNNQGYTLVNFTPLTNVSGAGLTSSKISYIVVMKK